MVAEEAANFSWVQISLNMRSSIEDDILPRSLRAQWLDFVEPPRPVIFVGISGGYICTSFRFRDVGVLVGRTELTMPVSLANYKTPNRTPKTANQIPGDISSPLTGLCGLCTYRLCHRQSGGHSFGTSVAKLDQRSCQTSK